MNIVVTTIMDLKHDKNGVISVANDLNRLLEGAGHTVSVVTPDSSRGAVTDRIVLRMTRSLGKMHRVTGSAACSLARLRLTAWGLGRRIVRHGDRCDAVIAHDLISAGAVLGAIGKRPLLLFCHFWAAPWEEFSEAGLLPGGSAPFRRLKVLMEQTLNDPRVTLVPVSGRNAALIRQIAPDCSPERIMIAYPGVSPLPAKLTTPVDADSLPVIINVGKIERRKNQRIIPLVAAELLRLGTPCRFLLTGTEEPGEAVFIRDEIQSLGVESLVEITGPCSREKVLEAISRADLYLHTSLMESFGMTLVEAMAAGTPVAALAYDAIGEILPETPETIIPAAATPSEIAGKLKELLSDRKRLNFIASRQAAVFEERFSSRAFLSRILDIIAAAGGRNG